MNKTKWIIFSVIVVAIIGGIIFLDKQNETTFKGDAAKVITEGPIADHVYGSADQRVVLIEYGDFQCPACGRMYPVIKQLKEKYKQQLTFVFRNMPLTNSHPNALAAATVAEAAGLQGKYYEMHDKLFEAQQAWSGASIAERTAVFEGYASELGLNIDNYRKDLSQNSVSAKIARDRATSRTFNANQTPTFVLDGQKIDETLSTDPEAFVKKIEDALKAAYPELSVPATPQQ